MERTSERMRRRTPRRAAIRQATRKPPTRRWDPNRPPVYWIEPAGYDHQQAKRNDKAELDRRRRLDPEGGFVVWQKPQGDAQAQALATIDKGRPRPQYNFSKLYLDAEPMTKAHKRILEIVDDPEVDPDRRKFSRMAQARNVSRAIARKDLDK
jgi:hypothetical protein